MNDKTRGKGTLSQVGSIKQMVREIVLGKLESNLGPIQNLDVDWTVFSVRLQAALAEKSDGPIEFKTLEENGIVSIIPTNIYTLLVLSGEEPPPLHELEGKTE